MSYVYNGMSVIESIVLFWIVTSIRSEKIGVGEEKTPTDISKFPETASNENTDFLCAVLDKDFSGSKMNLMIFSEHYHHSDGLLNLMARKCTIPLLTMSANTIANVTLNRPENIDNHDHMKFVIIVLETIDEFGEQLENLRKQFLWSPRAKHLVIISNEPADKGYVKLLFKHCWSHRVLNVGVIFSKHEKSYTYNPYFDNFCEEVDSTDLFYDKLRNMNGRKIRTKYIPFSGKGMVRYVKERDDYEFLGEDFGYMEAFVGNVNATPDLMSLSRSTVALYKNHSYRRRFWRTHKFEDAEMWFTTVIYDYSYEDRTEQLYPLGNNKLAVMVPKSAMITPSIFGPYRRTIWIYILTSILIFTSYSHAFNKLNGITDNAFVRTLGIFLGHHLPSRPLMSTEKFILGLWAMYSLLIVSAYGGALYGSLATINYRPEIDTLDDIRDSKIPIYAHQTVFNKLHESFASEGIQLFSLGHKDFIRDMKDIRGRAYIALSEAALYECEQIYLFENGVPLYHVMREYSIPVFTTFQLPYGSPYLDKLNRVVSACKEAGLNRFWNDQADWHALLEGTIILSLNRKRDVKRLSLEIHLTAFYIWGVGLVVSFICFLLEIKRGHKTKMNDV